MLAPVLCLTLFSISLSYRETLNAIMTMGHSRVPVYCGKPTNIVGIILVISEVYLYLIYTKPKAQNQLMMCLPLLMRDMIRMFVISKWKHVRSMLDKMTLNGVKYFGYRHKQYTVFL